MSLWFLRSEEPERYPGLCTTGQNTRASNNGSRHYVNPRKKTGHRQTGLVCACSYNTENKTADILIVENSYVYIEKIKIEQISCSQFWATILELRAYAVTSIHTSNR